MAPEKADDRTAQQLRPGLKNSARTESVLELEIGDERQVIGGDAGEGRARHVDFHYAHGTADEDVIDSEQGEVARPGGTRPPRTVSLHVVKAGAKPAVRALQRPRVEVA